MQWAILEFAFALVVVIGILALIIAESHIVERARQEQVWGQLREEMEQAWRQLRKEIVKA